MFKLACLSFLVLYQCCCGYPTKGISGELPDGTEIHDLANISANGNSSTNHQNGSYISSSGEHQEFQDLVIKIQNIQGTIIRLEDLINQPNTTTNNTSDEQQGVKKVVTKIKDKVKQVKDKVKGGFKDVKDKVKVGLDKVKDKLGKIGTGGGGGSGGGSKGGGGGYGYRDDYHRRDYDRPTSSGYGGGGGSVDPTFLWVLLGLGIAGVLGTALYFVIKK